MRVGPNMWNPPSCEELLYSCYIGVVNLTFSQKDSLMHKIIISHFKLVIIYHFKLDNTWLVYSSTGKALVITKF
jgi:hypothetical protein